MSKQKSTSGLTPQQKKVRDHVVKIGAEQATSRVIASFLWNDVSILKRKYAASIIRRLKLIGQWPVDAAIPSQKWESPIIAYSSIQAIAQIDEILDHATELEKKVIFSFLQRRFNESLKTDSREHQKAQGC